VDNVGYRGWREGDNRLGRKDREVVTAGAIGFPFGAVFWREPRDASFLPGSFLLGERDKVNGGV